MVQPDEVLSYTLFTTILFSMNKIAKKKKNECSIVI